MEVGEIQSLIKTCEEMATSLNELDKPRDSLCYQHAKYIGRARLTALDIAGILTSILSIVLIPAEKKYSKDDLVIITLIKSFYFFIRILQDDLYSLALIANNYKPGARVTMSSIVNNENSFVRLRYCDCASGYIDWFVGMRDFRNRLKDFDDIICKSGISYNVDPKKGFINLTVIFSKSPRFGDLYVESVKISVDDLAECISQSNTMLNLILKDLRSIVDSKRRVIFIPGDLSMIEIGTDELSITSMSLDYADQYFANYRRLTRYMAEKRSETVEILEEKIEKSINDMRGGKTVFLSVVKKTNDELIGAFTIDWRNSNCHVSLKGWLKDENIIDLYAQKLIEVIKDWIDNNIDYEKLIWPCSKSDKFSYNIGCHLGGEIHEDPKNSDFVTFIVDKTT